MISFLKKNLLYKEEHNAFSLDKFTKFVNCILNEYGVRINTEIKQIKKNKIVTKIYTYMLNEDIKNLNVYIARF